jgi:hypothetical protein
VLGQSILLHRLVWQRQASTVNWKGRIAKSVILNELIKTIASLMGKNGVIPLLLHSSEKKSEMLPQQRLCILTAQK